MLGGYWSGKRRRLAVAPALSLLDKDLAAMATVRPNQKESSQQMTEPLARVEGLESWYEARGPCTSAQDARASALASFIATHGFPRWARCRGYRLRI